MAEVKLEAVNLVKRYGDQAVVNGVSLRVHSGEVFGLVGPNGAGKTTTLEMMEGMRRPDSGTATVCGFDTVKASRKVRERIGLSFQTAAMPEQTTVVELINLYATFYDNPVPTGDLLRQFSLQDMGRSQAMELSGGQRQRLALALALVGRPEVLFLDEPTSGLDPQSRHSLWDVIRGLKADGRAVIITTHFMEEAEQLCDRVAVMDHGIILAEGDPRSLIREYGPESVIECDFGGATIDLSLLAQLDAVTGIKSEERVVMLNTANAAATLMAVASFAQSNNLPLIDVRTGTASMEDVFMALTGRRLRD
jgi:ABC-2 type transport system ATP-binding protein